MNSIHKLKEKHKNGASIDSSVRFKDKQQTALPRPDLFLRLLAAYQDHLNLIAQESTNSLSDQSFKQLAL